MNKAFYLLLILLCGCSRSEEIRFLGKIGDKFDSEIVLLKRGNDLQGYFRYLDRQSRKIVLQGNETGGNIYLEERDEHSKELTGIFEGTIDNDEFRGFWQDPSGAKKIPFLYYISKNESTGIKEDTTIRYSTFAKDEVFSFYNGLSASIGQKEFIIFHDTTGVEFCINIVDTRDYDNDGYIDVLVERVEACGGNAVPCNSLFFCTYDNSKKKFIISESFGSIVEPPVIEKWNESWSVKIISICENLEPTERYLLRNKKAVRVEYLEKAPLKAIIEVNSSEFEYGNKDRIKTIEYDLNGDKILDLITLEYWDRWNTMFWKVKFSDGNTFETGNACARLGILASKTNRVNDLVCGIDQVLQWNGKEYIPKEN